MEHVFIINPVAGKADARAFVLPRLEQAGKALGIQPVVVCTTRPGEAKEIAHRYAQKSAPVRLYACGGDGTLNEVFAGALGFEQAQVASVPCGSGNDFIRTFGMDAPFLDMAAQMQGNAVPIDLIAVNGGVCASICSVGVDSEVAYGIPKFRRIPLCSGPMAYQLSIALRVLQPLAKRLHIEADGEVFDGEYIIATVCNGKSYGGGYFAAPQADVTDGLLDVLLVKKISRLRLAKVLGVYKRGEHLQAGKVCGPFQDIMQFRRVRQICIRPLDGKRPIVNIDGECAPAEGLCARVMPLAAKFVLPAGLPSATAASAAAMQAAQ